MSSKKIHQADIISVEELSVEESPRSRAFMLTPMDSGMLTPQAILDALSTYFLTENANCFTGPKDEDLHS